MHELMFTIITIYSSRTTFNFNCKAALCLAPCLLSWCFRISALIDFMHNHYIHLKSLNLLAILLSAYSLSNVMIQCGCWTHQQHTCGNSAYHLMMRSLYHIWCMKYNLWCCEIPLSNNCMKIEVIVCEVIYLQTDPGWHFLHSCCLFSPE